MYPKDPDSPAAARSAISKAWTHRHASLSKRAYAHAHLNGLDANSVGATASLAD